MGLGLVRIIDEGMCCKFCEVLFRGVVYFYYGVGRYGEVGGGC